MNRNPLRRNDAHVTNGATTAATTIQTVAVSDVVGLPGGLVAHGAAQTTAASDIRVHVCAMREQRLTGTRREYPAFNYGSFRLVPLASLAITG